MTDPLRPCKECGIPKPFNITNFPMRHTKGGKLYLRMRCRDCTRKANAASAAKCAQGEQPKPPANTKFCKDCAGLPWRVPAIRCPSCGLRHAPEPPVELVFYRSYERIA